MTCTFCSADALTRFPSTGDRLCRCCLQLLRKPAWDRLALRWLRYHPDAWVSDVASWLEHTYTRDHGG